MGTSSSYKGSSGKIPRALRDGLNDWADAQASGNTTDIPQQVVAQALRIPTFSRNTGGSSSGGGGGGAGGLGGGGRSGGRQSEPQRRIASYAGTAGRAAALARALRDGDREAIERAGLDFDALSKLSNRAELVRAIVDVVCAAQPGSDISSEEQRQIAGKLVDWMLDDQTNQVTPDAAETAEHAIGLIAAEVFLSEAGDDLISHDGLSREEMIARINATSQAIASKANLSDTATDADSISKAISKGIRALRKIYPAEAPNA